MTQLIYERVGFTLDCKIILPRDVIKMCYNLLKCIGNLMMINEVYNNNGIK